VATHAAIEQSVAAAWHWAADPHAPLAAVLGVTWTSIEVTVEQVAGPRAVTGFSHIHRATFGTV
jgi:hypothetical protein